jgi:hypothetical protein
MNWPKGLNEDDLEAGLLLLEVPFDTVGTLLSGAVEAVDFLSPRLAGRSQ